LREMALLGIAGGTKRERSTEGVRISLLLMG